MAGRGPVATAGLETAADADILLREQCRHRRAFVGPPAIRGGEQQSRQPRMHRQLEDSPAHRRDPPRLARDRPDRGQQPGGRGETLGVRRLEPSEPTDGSLWPHECSASSVPARSTRRISGS